MGLSWLKQEVFTMPTPAQEKKPSSKETKPKAKEHVPVVLDPCEKAHDAEHHRLTDEDGACDDGVN
jgi:hypothetical protein